MFRQTTTQIQTNHYQNKTNTNNTTYFEYIGGSANLSSYIYIYICMYIYIYILLVLVVLVVVLLGYS